MWIAAVFLFCLFTAPIRLELIVHTRENTETSGILRVMIWGVKTARSFRLQKQDQQFILRFKKKRLPLKKLGFKKQNRLTAAFPPLRRYLKRLSFRLNMRLYASIGMQDAALTAIICGGLKALLGLIPSIQAAVFPDYKAKEYSMKFHCIAETRLGNLFLTFLWVGIACAARSLSGGTFSGNHQRSKNQFGHADSP
ncbi:MAG: DUF2953 domain-containing protein [Clostridia bacterium]|nr:DUF2953 domain-containing protein [Clostridia bacterium]